MGSGVGGEETLLSSQAYRIIIGNDADLVSRTAPVLVADPGIMPQCTTQLNGEPVVTSKVNGTILY